MEPERRVLLIGAGADPLAPGSVSISVADRGCGIPPHARERLVSPFFSTKAAGMGMGLKICRTVVESHGGTLTYADSPGGGTVFRFSLHAASPAKT
jgi:two-component system sensor histidine kinase DctS